MSSYSTFDITIWEQIRFVVQLETDRLLRKINQEISNDRSLRDYHGMYPVPWQLQQVVLQRADTWVQRLYDLCCDAYKRTGKELSAEFDRAIWAYWIEPFIKGERESTGTGYKFSELMELLLCAVGSPPEKRNQLTVGQKNCCLDVRNEMFFSWQQKLLRLARRLDKPTAFGATQFTTTRTIVELPSEPSRSRPPVPPAPKPVQTQATSLLAAAQPPVQPSPTRALNEQNKVSGPEQSVPVPRYSGAAKWQNIEIVFLSDFRVQIRINGKQTEPTNYAELGFADGRSENPNKSWVTLRFLAEHRGVLKDGSAVGEPWPKVEKRIQEIRKVLRELFGIPTDPLPFVEGVGYQAVFKIRCGPSFHT